MPRSSAPLLPLRFREVGSLALYLLPVALFLWEFWAPVAQGDDAFISYRYAVNLVEGRGLVFNAGERVEGYTNLLWTLLIAAGIALGFDAPSLNHVLSLACGALLLIASQVYTARLLPGGPGWSSLAVPLAVLSSNAFACWITSGLETPLFAALVTLALIAHAASRIGWACVFCVLATSTRPDGALVAGLVLGSDWIRRLVAQRPGSARQLLAVSAPCLAYAGYLAAHTTFRLLYYGDVVPNTFHAKVGGIPIQRGFEYLRDFLVDGAWLLLPAALAGALFVPTARMGAALVGVTALYVIGVGGDAYWHGRFLLPVLPALTALALAGSRVVFARSRILGLALALGIVGFVPWSLYVIGPTTREFVGVPREVSLASHKRMRARDLDLLARDALVRDRTDAIRRLDPPIRILAAVGIGRVGYYLPEVTILDLVGLTDRHIAKSPTRVEGALVLPGHHRTDADYVLDREPDLIWIPRSPRRKNGLPCELELLTNPRLYREYVWDERLQLYARRRVPAPQAPPSG